MNDSLVLLHSRNLQSDYSKPECNRLKVYFPPLPLPEEDSYRGFVKSKLFSETVDQVPVIGKMDCLGIVADNGKGGRPACNLRYVEELDAPAAVQRGGMGGGNLLEYAVEAVGGKFPAELFVDGVDCRQ